MTAPTRSSSSRGFRPSRGGALLHPGLLFTLVWAAVLGAWGLTPPSEFIRLTSSEKYISVSAIAFFLAALAAFVIGTVVGPAMFRSDRPARVRLADLDPAALRTLSRGAAGLFAVGALASGYLLAVGVMRAGGPSALLHDIGNGTSSVRLADEYFKPAKIGLVTVWLHLLVGAAPLAAVAAVGTGGAAKLRQLAILTVGLLVALALSFAFAERLIAFAFVVAAALAWGSAKSATRTERGIRFRVVVRLVSVGALIAALWLMSEISRTYLGSRTASGPVGISDVSAGTPLAADRYLAYVITSTNNGMYGVDHFRTPAYFYSTLSAVTTTLNWDTGSSPFVGPGVGQANAALEHLYPANNPLTTFSLPGFAFLDLGWPSLAVLFWFGAVIGSVHARFRRDELWALVVYPLCVVGILDSYREMYWTRTEMIVPLLGVLLAITGVYRIALLHRRRLAIATPRGRALPVASALAMGPLNS